MVKYQSLSNLSNLIKSIPKNEYAVVILEEDNVDKNKDAYINIQTLITDNDIAC